MLNAKVFALTNAATHRDVQRSLRRRGARARDAHAADAREREGGGHRRRSRRSRRRRSRSSTGSSRPGGATTRRPTKLAQQTSDLVAGENNPRKMEPVHELQGLIALRQKIYQKAVTELRLADQTQLHNKYLLAQALEATNGEGRSEEALQGSGGEQFQHGGLRAVARGGAQEGGLTLADGGPDGRERSRGRCQYAPSACFNRRASSRTIGGVMTDTKWTLHGQRVRQLQLFVRLPLPVQRAADARQLLGSRRHPDRQGTARRRAARRSARRGHLQISGRHPHGQRRSAADRRQARNEAQRNALLRIMSGQDTRPGATMFQVFFSMLTQGSR